MLLSGLVLYTFCIRIEVGIYLNSVEISDIHIGDLRVFFSLDYFLTQQQWRINQNIVEFYLNFKF